MSALTHASLISLTVSYYGSWSCQYLTDLHLVILYLRLSNEQHNFAVITWYVMLQPWSCGSTSDLNFQLPGPQLALLNVSAWEYLMVQSIICFFWSTQWTLQLTKRLCNNKDRNMCDRYILVGIRLRTQLWSRTIYLLNRRETHHIVFKVS